MKKMIIISAMAIIIAACGNQNGTPANSSSSEVKSDAATGGVSSYDPKRGEGKFSKVDVSPNLDVAMAEEGSKIYNVKCNACHKLTSEKLVGPGWQGVTKKLAAEWIMNFATNTDEMLNKDPEAKAQLEICLVRMPNQNLSDKDARNVYEFMRKNDGVK
jgi:cytochrome c551/c552